ncbi:FapA family protein [Neobacillus drentensis]|uniref:FapA family protein n=1 Tax=Neobacillus drentensis TaxID=220684 RepID=UPI002FFE2918
MMSEVMISRGKTLNQAIESGLGLLNIPKSQVDIEILQPETKRFFGILGTKPAVVRLIKKQNHEDVGLHKGTRQSNRTGSPEKGMIWVKDGQVLCKETDHHYPTITPVKGVNLYKNGELVRKTTVLMEKDQVKIELKSEWKGPSWSISLDSRKMEATLQVEPGYRKTYRLVDQKPCSHLQLEVTVQEEIINPLQPIHIEQRMKELGIKTGIQKEEIRKAMEATEPGQYLIAKGVEPLKGEDGWLETVVDTNWENNRLKLMENGYDIKKLITLYNVETGHLLGIIHPPKPGKVGCTVTGESIKPDAVGEMEVHNGRGVDIIDQGSKLVAVDSGRLSIQFKELKARVSVIPRLFHSTDVDISTGNLRYHGDIEVKGNVNEGMELVALCDLLVQGTVDQSKLTAGNSIIICQNVFNSYLNAGKSSQMILQIEHLMRKISADLKGFALAIDQVYQSPVFKTSDIVKMGLSSMIKILLEKKFKTLPALIKELNELISRADQLKILDTEIKELQVDLSNGFLKVLPSQFQETVDIITLADRIHNLCPDVREDDAMIILPYALNSELSCCGDISITGKGCINSTVHSEGKVKINGILRGGEVYAALGVEAEETGTKGGLPTRIRVPEGQTIKINHAMEGTIIQIGNQIYQFDREENNIFARVTVAGRLLLF